MATPNPCKEPSGTLNVPQLFPRLFRESDLWENSVNCRPLIRLDVEYLELKSSIWNWHGQETTPEMATGIESKRGTERDLSPGGKRPTRQRSEGSGQRR